MPTCGRCPELQYLVEEAIESFRIQDYPLERRELLIWNDARDQILICDTPGVRIINTNERAGSLGEKYNLMLAESRGSMCCCFEDDDISLSHRLSLSVEMLGDADAFNPRSYFVLVGGSPTLTHERGTGYAHNASMYRKDAALRVGGYPADCRQDAGMDGRLRAGCKVVPNEPLTAEQSFYVYRWSVGPHLSGNPDPEVAWKAYGERQFLPGVYHLKPRFLRDYPAMARNLVASHSPSLT